MLITEYLLNALIYIQKNEFICILQNNKLINSYKVYFYKHLMQFVTLCFVYA